MVTAFVNTAKLAAAINLGVHPYRVHTVQEYAGKSVVRVDLGVHNRLYPTRILDIDTDTAQEVKHMLQQINPVITRIEKRSDSAGCWDTTITDVAFEIAKSTQTIIKQGNADKTDHALLSTCEAILEWSRMRNNEDKPFERDGVLASRSFICAALNYYTVKRDGSLAVEWIAIATLMGLRGTNAILYLLGQVRPRFTETGWIVESY